MRRDVDERASSEQRTYLLQDAFLYGNTSEHDHIGRLLCQYLLFVGNIERVRGAYDASISFLNKAAAISKDREYKALETEACYLRGYSFFNRWRVTPNREENRADLLESIADCNAGAERLQEARSTKEFVSQPLEVALYSVSGAVLAHTAQDTKDSTDVRSKLKKAEMLLGQNNKERDSLFIEIDENWCHIHKTEALIGLGWSNSALTELNSVTKGDPRKKRRYLGRDIVESQAYLAKGKIEIGAAYAENALMIALKIGSQEHINRIASLYDMLRRNEEYTRNPDAIHLGIQLLKVQHPEVFLSQA